MNCGGALVEANSWPGLRSAARRAGRDRPEQPEQALWKAPPVGEERRLPAAGYLLVTGLADFDRAAGASSAFERSTDCAFW